jgi:hypothetical protein
MGLGPVGHPCPVPGSARASPNMLASPRGAVKGADAGASTRNVLMMKYNDLKRLC